ncbi:MAG: DUF427 domain-containing protein [Roseibium sp.]|uniref:DUF427 domain-containing protein n=1 Tax=Roseibium sp. TaxID=1936156 RepID=UPI001B1199B8|nr:DUF427 domain-containing protein [Roseibium sp.]MBO6894572.1 DUF427 domain-containing protein [Roseibium sp.]MBO6929510.1 DUF427 domain-containing protein [Roseibium sp.]
MSVLESAAFDDAIRNPDNAFHLMVIKDVPRRVRVYAGDVLLAESENALRVLEVGKSVYDPVIYVPESDLRADFSPLDKSTYCPIKGDASYVALDGEELAWVYKTPLDMTRRLAGHYAFWPSKVRLVEGD